MHAIVVLLVGLYVLAKLKLTVIVVVDQLSSDHGPWTRGGRDAAGWVEAI